VIISFITLNQDKSYFSTEFKYFLRHTYNTPNRALYRVQFFILNFAYTSSIKMLLYALILALYLNFFLSVFICGEERKREIERERLRYRDGNKETEKQR
jgi:hypothetical protein